MPDAPLPVHVLRRTSTVALPETRTPSLPLSAQTLSRMTTAAFLEADLSRTVIPASPLPVQVFFSTTTLESRRRMPRSRFFRHVLPTTRAPAAPSREMPARRLRSHVLPSRTGPAFGATWTPFARL